MEPSASPQVVSISSKKHPNILWMMFMMLRNKITKSKFMSSLQNIMSKRGKVTGKAIKNLLFHHNSSHVSSFVAAYEFSCSATPLHHQFNNKRKGQRSHNFSPTHYSTVSNKDIAVTALEKISELLNNEDPEASPALPGFGRTPIVRQLRVTDSPFPLRGDEGSHVDKQAGEFIERFYAQLRLEI
ncbi:Avr9/Cf-9 rapidly elicited protein [Thalictrum thalictroides]|uniref:Avr9/Cf-9 rapidly elicited protein n=1 Tax=Thalictrum thalictroides TaxID=46969 RepID=A0A7J6XEY8_THATH|nr:Avr9/Cf-9 rapidly elicited protein [Thalictrum thalictroides]